MNLSDTDQAPYSAPAPQTATVSDEAIEAAAKHSYEYEGDRKGILYVGWEYEGEQKREYWRDSVRQVLTAALPHLVLSASPCSVEVKKLRWRKPTDHPQDMEGECSSVANGIGGRYSISNPERNKDGVYGWLLYLADDEFRWEWFPSIAEAKAAAQDDHDLRILSQIVTKPVDVAAVLEQCAIIAEGFRDKHWIAHDIKTGIFPNRSEAGIAIAAAIRALSPAEPVDQWQDISTAPKNGGFLATNSKEVWAAWHYDSANWHAKYGSRGATHWMPLPAAPTSKGGE